MLNKLTPEQESRLPHLRQKWLNKALHNGKPLSLAEARLEAQT